MEKEDILNRLRNHRPKILGSEGFSKYAVLLPLIEKDGETHILFEVRSLELRRQPGEICFPGGRIDPQDADEESAAIRETIEELGIRKEDISEAFPLDYFISAFGMIIYPYAAFIKRPEHISPNPEEVGEIFTVPIHFFINNPPEVYRVNFKAEPEENFPLERIAGGGNYNWQTRSMDEHFYTYGNKVIWGLTARILSHYIQIMRQ
ncbi:NUDIX hydrolase [Peribacillus sp. SCS-155]|uniref:NUDIX hydrolase n=1 Tax=Peribacillus sedimenti TaxID=3115297 RepID=UPI003906AF2E